MNSDNSDLEKNTVVIKHYSDCLRRVSEHYNDGRIERGVLYFGQRDGVWTRIDVSRNEFTAEFFNDTQYTEWKLSRPKQPLVKAAGR